MVNSLMCPHCGNVDGKQIVGHEERGIYDGTLWWECMACNLGWARDFGPGMGRRNAASAEYVERHNRQVTA